MAEVLFYHLTASPADQVLPDLLEKTLARGWRAVVRCGSEPAMAMLDTRLWTYREDSFLPHGTAAAGHAARQPVYLTCGSENPNAAEVLMLAPGASADPAEFARYTRVCLLFEDADAEAVAAARADWRAVVAAGLPARYWAQEGGRWVEKARSGPEAGAAGDGQA
jgi:DNA polymerase-3 subunit chi